MKNEILFFEQKNFDGPLPILYCEEGARQGWAVLQYSAQLCHHIITVAATQGAAGRWAGALGARRQARQACVGAGSGAQAGVRGRAGRRQQRACAWACAEGGAQASWACAAGGAQARWA